jgi:hypothetical protein
LLTKVCPQIPLFLFPSQSFVYNCFSYKNWHPFITNYNYSIIVAVTTIETHFLPKGQHYFKVSVTSLPPLLSRIVSPLTSHCLSIHIVISIETDRHSLPLCSSSSYVHVLSVFIYCSFPSYICCFNHSIFSFLGSYDDPVNNFDIGEG